MSLSKFNNIVKSAILKENKIATDTKHDTKQDADIKKKFSSSGFDSLGDLEKSSKNKQKTDSDIRNIGKVADKRQTANIRVRDLDDEVIRNASAALSDLADIDISGEEDIDIGGDITNDTNIGTPTKVTVDNLPAVVSTDLMNMSNKSGESFNLTWHKLTNLPGYAVAQIRAYYRPLFKALGDSPMESFIISSTHDKTTSPGDMKKVAAAISNHGRKISEAHIDAPHLQGYINAIIYEHNGVGYIVAEEEAFGLKGYYILATPFSNGKITSN